MYFCFAHNYPHAASLYVDLDGGSVWVDRDSYDKIGIFVSERRKFQRLIEVNQRSELRFM